MPAAFRGWLVLLTSLTVAACSLQDGSLAPTAPDASLQRLTISCARPANTVVCEAFAHYSDGSVQSVTAQAAWSSSDVTIAGIARGIVTSVRGGTFEIAASYQGATARVQLTLPRA